MLGNRLRQARLAAKLTQEELAFQAGITRNYVSLLELDQKSPTVNVLFKLCDALGTVPSVLLAEVEKHRRVGKKR